MKWVREPVVEAYLKKMGLPFEVETIQIKDIDLNESINRQVRIGKKLSDDLLLEYAEAMKAPGAVFPMPILNRIKKHIWIWSGNHRVHSAQLIDLTSVEAYVVSVTDPRVQDLIPRVVNAWTGRRPSRDEFLLHAQYLIETHRMEPKEAGQLLGLRPDWITGHMRTVQVANKITEQGVSPEGLSKTTLIKLAPLTGNNNVLRETVKFIRKNKIAGDQAIQLIEDVRRGGTEAKQIAELKKWEATFQDREEKKPPPFRTGVRKRFMTLVTGFRNFITKIKKSSELQLAPEDIPNVVRYWREIEVQMTHLMGDK